MTRDRVKDKLIMATRIIATSGQYQFTEEERKAKRIQVFGGAVEQPSNQYSNLKYPLAETFYGYAQLCVGELVIATKQLKYDGERIFLIERPLDDYLAEQFYCFTIASLERSAQEWTQYTALPFTLVSAALQAYFLDQATQLDPLILELLPVTKIRFKLYSTTAYKVDVRSEPFEACSASTTIAFEEPDEIQNPPQFPDSPPGTNTPNPPYPSGDNDTPEPPSNPSGIGNSGYNYGQPYGTPGQNAVLRFTINTPSGGCGDCDPVPGLISCSEYPYTIDIPVSGSWIVDPVVRVLNNPPANNGAYSSRFQVLDASTANLIPVLLISGSYNPLFPNPVATSSINCILNAVDITNLEVL